MGANATKVNDLELSTNFQAHCKNSWRALGSQKLWRSCDLSRASCLRNVAGPKLDDSTADIVQGLNTLAVFRLWKLKTEGDWPESRNLQFLVRFLTVSGFASAN